MAGERRVKAFLWGAAAVVALAGCGGGGGGGADGAGNPTGSPTSGAGGPTGPTTVTVTFASRAGWAAASDNCAARTPTGDQGFLPGPGTPPRGAGSYGMVVGADPESFEAIFHPALDSTRVAAVTALSFGTFVAHPGGEAPGVLAPYLVLVVDTTGDNVGDDLLVYMPGANGTVAVGAWQTWDALPGVWCDSTGCGTRAEFLALHPNARIVNEGAIPGFAVAVGCGAGVLAWTGFEAAVDAVTIGTGGGTTVYDFEP